METVLKNFTDPYERKARLYPALLAAIPVIVFIALYTDWLTFDLKNTLYITVAVAGLFLLTGKTRDLGKEVENRLVKKWGGMPSVTLLRHRDNMLNCYIKKRYHKAAAALVGFPLPDPTQEGKDPTDADERYQAVTTVLLSKTRDISDYPLLFKENINYGFWRNLRGVKPIACLLAAVLVTYGLWLDRALLLDLQAPEGIELAVVVIGIVILFLWFLTITDEAVRRAANNYAQRLLEALNEK